MNLAGEISLTSGGDVGRHISLLMRLVAVAVVVAARLRGTVTSRQLSTESSSPPPSLVVIVSSRCSRCRWCLRLRSSCSNGAVGSSGLTVPIPWLPLVLTGSIGRIGRIGSSLGSRGRIRRSVGIRVRNKSRGGRIKVLVRVRMSMRRISVQIPIRIRMSVRSSVPVVVRVSVCLSVCIVSSRLAVSITGLPWSGSGATGGWCKCVGGGGRCGWSC